MSGFEDEATEANDRGIGLVNAWAPYALLGGLLVLTRLPALPLGGWLRTPAIRWDDILGSGVSGATTPLYLPGFILLVVVGLTALLHRMTFSDVQAVGAAAGNMVAIHNVVAASATVGLLDREGATLRKTILPTIYYLLVLGILGLVAVHVIGLPDPLMGG